MIENVVRSIGGVGAYGIFSVLLFFVFFTVMLAWVARVKKSYVKSMQALPLEDCSPTQATNAQCSETHE